MPKVGQVLRKRCIECGVEKPVAEFWKHRSTADGYFNRCRMCAAPRTGPNAVVRDKPDEGVKYCPRCKKTRPKIEFQKNRTSSDGCQNYCKECYGVAAKPGQTEKQCPACGNTFPLEEGFHRCRTGYQARCRACNYEQARKSKFKREYDITPEQYEAMVLEQKGVCFLCGKQDTRTIWGKTPRLSVDHCHACGVVRRLLCFDCNQGIGLFKEDTELLRRVIVYLEEHKSTCTPPVGISDLFSPT